MTYRQLVPNKCLKKQMLGCIDSFVYMFSCSYHMRLLAEIKVDVFGPWIKYLLLWNWLWYKAVQLTTLISLANLFSFTSSDLYKDLPTESIRMLKHFELCKRVLSFLSYIWRFPETKLPFSYFCWRSKSITQNKRMTPYTCHLLIFFLVSSNYSRDHKEVA